MFPTTETEGQRESTQHGVLPLPSWRRWVKGHDLYCGGRAVPPAMFYCTACPGKGRLHGAACSGDSSRCCCWPCIAKCTQNIYITEITQGRQGLGFPCAYDSSGWRGYSKVLAQHAMYCTTWQQLEFFLVVQSWAAPARAWAVLTALTSDHHSKNPASPPPVLIWAGRTSGPARKVGLNSCFFSLNSIYWKNKSKRCTYLHISIVCGADPEAPVAAQPGDLRAGGIQQSQDPRGDGRSQDHHGEGGQIRHQVSNFRATV